MSIQTQELLSTLRQCALMGISRSSVYYRPRAPSQKDLALMKQIDQQPGHALLRVAAHEGLAGQARPPGKPEEDLERLMRAMGLQAIYRRPRTSQPGLGHNVSVFTRPNQVLGNGYHLRPMARATSSTWWPSWIGTGRYLWWLGGCLKNHDTLISA